MSASMQAVIITVVSMLMVAGGIVGVWAWRVKHTAWDDHTELTRNFSVVSYFLGFTAVQSFGVSPLLGEGLDSWWTLAWVAGGVVAATLAAFIADWEADHLIQRVSAGLKDRLSQLPDVPLPAALVKLGVFIMTTLAVMGAFSGHSGSVALNVSAAALLIAVALVAAPVIFHLTPVLTRVLLPKRVREGNRAAAVTALGQFVYIGLALYYATAGDFSDLKTLIVRTLVGLLAAFAGGLLLAKLIDILVLKGVTVRSLVESGGHWEAAATLAGLLALSAGVASPALDGLVTALLA